MRACTPPRSPAAFNARLSRSWNKDAGVTTCRTSLLRGTGGQIQDPRGVTLNGGKPLEERDGQDVALTTDICWALHAYKLPKKKENYFRPFGFYSL